MCDTRKIVKEKLAIAIEATNCGNIKATARKHSFAPNQIRRWIKMTGEPRDAVDHCPRVRSLNKGPPVAEKTIEDKIYERIVDLRKKDMPVTTLLIIAKSLTLNGVFRGDSIVVLRSWAYPFLARRSLLTRRVTREGQKLSERFATNGTLSRVSGSGFVNMDKTPVFFETEPNQTVNKKGERTIAIHCSGSNVKRVIICAACASDGTKLPRMFGFKGKTGGKIEQNIHEELSIGTFGCCDDKGWMDERSCRIGSRRFGCRMSP